MADESRHENDDSLSEDYYSGKIPPHEYVVEILKGDDGERRRKQIIQEIRSLIGI